MSFPTLVAVLITQLILTCVNATVKKVVPKKRVLLLHLDNSGSAKNFMNGSTIYLNEQEQCKKYALERLNSGEVDEVYISTWNSTSTQFVKLLPTMHLIRKKEVTGFSNWALPEPSGGTTPSNAFNEAERLIKTLGANCEYEYVIATDGTHFDGISEGFPQTQLFDACKRLMSLKNVTMTVIGIIPQQVDYTKITESQPIPGLTLANLLFQYVFKCMICSGNETTLTTVFQKQEQNSSSGILFCNEFRLPHGTNIITFLKELVKVVQPYSEHLTLEQYDILLDSVVSLCRLQLLNIVNPLKKKVTWFEQVKSGMDAIGSTVYLKADPTLTKQQVKDAVSEKFTENYVQVCQGSTRMCSGEWMNEKRHLFQEVGKQLKELGTLPVDADKALFIVHDVTIGSYKFVRANDPNIRGKLCTVQGMPHSGYNYTSLALPDITDPRILKESSQLVRQAVRGSSLIILPNFKGDIKDPVFIFMWGVEWVKGFLSGLPTNSDHMEILNLLFCIMTDKKVMGQDGCESTLLQEWKKGIFPERLDDGKSILQVLMSPYLDLNGIEPHDMEGLLFAMIDKSVFESFVKHEQICTLRLRMGLQHPPSFDEFMAYVSTKYAPLKLTDKQIDVPFYYHLPYSPFQQDVMDMGEVHGQLWSVLPHTINGNHCDVKHQDGGFHCTDLERINMMGCNGGKCLYCRQPLMPCHFEKVEGSWPTLKTFLDIHIPMGTPPPAPAVQESVAPAPIQQTSSVQRSMTPSLPPTPRVSIAQGVPPMPNRMSNNRNKTWAKYQKLYTKTGDQAHLNVLLEMVREESSKHALSAP
jgi:hypothetical protein